MPWFAPSFNVAPQSFQPIVRLNADDGKKEFSLARWGLVPFWAHDAKIGFSTINARGEEAASKPAFREAMKKRRCLVPSDAFYEWKRPDAKTKIPFAIALADKKPFALAGLWERWTPEDGPALETFTVLTTEPNELMAQVHDRMPVILDPEDYVRWLDPGSSNAVVSGLLRPYPAERMRAWMVSSRVGNVRNNDTALLDPEAEG